MRQDGAGVELALADGSSLPGARAVLALPVNTLPALAFEPALPAATAEALGTNAGRALKLWLRARGVPAGVLAAGAGEGLHWLYADRTLDGGDVLLLGFGYEDPAFDPSSRADVERALHAFFPEAELIAFDHHDWNRRPLVARHLGDGRRRARRAADRRALPAPRAGRVRDLGRRVARGGLDRGRADRRRRGGGLGARGRLRARSDLRALADSEIAQAFRRVRYATRWRASLSSSISMPRPGPEGTRT